MKSRRRIALLAAVAVLFTALWPLATALGYAARDEAMPLCHMAGMQVASDSMPMPMALPGEGGKPAPQQGHCPLCVMVFFAAFTPELVAPPHVALVLAILEPRAPTPLGRRFPVVLPASRAPPPALVA